MTVVPTQKPAARSLVDPLLPRRLEPEAAGSQGDDPAGSTGQRPAGAAQREPKAKGRLAVLDGLRLLAALMVVVYHYLAQGDGPWQADSRRLFGFADVVSGYGWLGVQLFFVISGFVICMSAWGRPVGDFFVSRAVRRSPRTGSL